MDCSSFCNPYGFLAFVLRLYPETLGTSAVYPDLTDLRLDLVKLRLHPLAEVSAVYSHLGYLLLSSSHCYACSPPSPLRALHRDVWCCFEHQGLRGYDLGMYFHDQGVGYLGESFVR